MKRRLVNQSLFRGILATIIAVTGAVSLTGLNSSVVAAEVAAELSENYVKGDYIHSEVFVSDKSGSNISLSALLGGDVQTQLNVLFIFGGGDLGSGETGHLWCQDSFEDTHILRTLVSKYQGQGINFIAVASAPVYHSQALGFPAGVFLNEEAGSTAFQAAQKAFVDSTMEAYEDGILPIEPYFDSRFRLMMNRAPQLVPGEAYGEIASWQGAFRDEQETQFYGVPSFWVLSNDGKVLAEPMRGNIYHPHGAQVNINYTFNDMDKLLQSLL